MRGSSGLGSRKRYCSPYTIEFIVSTVGAQDLMCSLGVFKRGYIQERASGRQFSLFVWQLCEIHYAASRHRNQDLGWVDRLGCSTQDMVLPCCLAVHCPAYSAKFQSAQENSTQISGEGFPSILICPHQVFRSFVS